MMIPNRYEICPKWDFVAPKKNSRDKWRMWQLVFFVLGVIHKWSKSDNLLLVRMWNERMGDWSVWGNDCEQITKTFLLMFVKKYHLLLHHILHQVLYHWFPPKYTHLPRFNKSAASQTGWIPESCACGALPSCRDHVPATHGWVCVWWSGVW